MNDENKNVARRSFWGRRDPSAGERPTAIRPANCQTALQWLRRKALRLWCPTHGMQSVIDLIDIEDLPRAWAGDVLLACNCTRTHVVAVGQKDWRE
jgi:hypothetical protein